MEQSTTSALRVTMGMISLEDVIRVASTGDTRASPEAAETQAIQAAAVWTGGDPTARDIIVAWLAEQGRPIRPDALADYWGDIRRRGGGPGVLKYAALVAAHESHDGAGGDAWSFSRSVARAGSVGNARIALRLLGHASGLGYDEWRCVVTWGGEPLGASRRTRRLSVAALRTEMESVFGPTLGYCPTAEAVNAALEAEAHARPYNSVVDRLRALKWDGVERLATAGRFLGQAPDDEVGNAVVSLIIEGAVVRALEPGCGFPYIPIAYSPHQGPGKQDYLELAAPGGWTEMPHLDGPDATRRMFEALRGRSIAELGEIDDLGGRRQSAAKRLATLTEATFRDAYGREATPHPLAGIIVGTTNVAHFLTDNSHRRNPIVAIPDGFYVDRELLAAEMPHMWAEVVHRYDAGHYQLPGRASAMVRLPERLWAQANAASARHEAGSAVMDCLAGIIAVSGEDFFATDYLIGELANRNIARPADAELSRCLSRLGLTRHRSRRGGGHQRGWRRPDGWTMPD